MSIVMPESPLWLQEVKYPARIDRQLIDMWTEGVVEGLAVTQRAEGANFSVDVGAGKAVIKGDNQSAQGSYLGYLTGKVNVTLAPPAALGRIDLIVMRIDDAQAGGPAGDNGKVVPIGGTPSASPTPPALPSTAIELARVTVAAGAASVVNSAISTAFRSVATARGGVPRFATTAARDAALPAPQVGDMCVVTDWPWSPLVYGLSVATGTNGWLGTLAAGIAFTTNASAEAIVNFPTKPSGGAPFISAPILSGMVDVHSQGAIVVHYGVITGYPNAAGMIVGARDSVGTGTGPRAGGTCWLQYLATGRT